MNRYLLHVPRTPIDYSFKIGTRIKYNHDYALYCEKKNRTRHTEYRGVIANIYDDGTFRIQWDASKYIMGRTTEPAWVLEYE